MDTELARQERLLQDGQYDYWCAEDSLNAAMAQHLRYSCSGPVFIKILVDTELRVRANADEHPEHRTIGQWHHWIEAKLSEILK